MRGANGQWRHCVASRFILAQLLAHGSAGCFENVEMAIKVRIWVNMMNSKLHIHFSTSHLHRSYIGSRTGHGHGADSYDRDVWMWMSLAICIQCYTMAGGWEYFIYAPCWIIVNSLRNLTILINLTKIISISDNKLVVCKYIANIQLPLN